MRKVGETGRATKDREGGGGEEKEIQSKLCPTNIQEAMAQTPPFPRALSLSLSCECNSKRLCTA